LKIAVQKTWRLPKSGNLHKFIRFDKRRIDHLGGVERLQIGMILPVVRDTSIAQQLCHGFIQGIDSVAADCLQVKAGIAGVVQNRGILAAIQQGVFILCICRAVGKRKSPAGSTVSDAKRPRRS